MCVNVNNARECTGMHCVVNALRMRLNARECVVSGMYQNAECVQCGRNARECAQVRIGVHLSAFILSVHLSAFVYINIHYYYYYYYLTVNASECITVVKCIRMHRERMYKNARECVR